MVDEGRWKPILSGTKTAMAELHPTRKILSPLLI
jgi:hypothetical protein